MSFDLGYSDLAETYLRDLQALRARLARLERAAGKALKFLETPDPDYPGATREQTGRNNGAWRAARDLRAALAEGRCEEPQAREGER